MQFEEESNQNVSASESQATPDNQISDVTTDQSNEADAAVQNDSLDDTVEPVHEEDPVLSENLDNIDHPVECENCQNQGPVMDEEKAALSDDDSNSDDKILVDNGVVTPAQDSELDNSELNSWENEQLEGASGQVENQDGATADDFNTLPSFIELSMNEESQDEATYESESFEDWEKIIDSENVEAEANLPINTFNDDYEKDILMDEQREAAQTNIINDDHQQVIITPSDSDPIINVDQELNNWENENIEQSIENNQDSQVVDDNSS